MSSNDDREVDGVRIGELSKRSGTSRRLLRYYEEQGLIFPTRSGNGYRDYDERYVDRVAQIRGLLDAGLPTRIIKEVLPCLDKPRGIYLPNPSAETIATLEHERDRMTARIESLTVNRDAIAEYLEVVRPRATRRAAARALAPGRTRRPSSARSASR